MSSIGSNQSSKRWELVSIAECESSGLLVTFFMAWSPGRRFNADDSRLITTETTPPSIPTNPATGPRRRSVPTHLNAQIKPLRRQCDSSTTCRTNKVPNDGVEMLGEPPENVTLLAAQS